MDRYTRLQELTRMMAESVGDVTTVQQNLLKNLDGAESALHAQSSRDGLRASAVADVRAGWCLDSLRRASLSPSSARPPREPAGAPTFDIIGGQIEIDRSVPRGQRPAPGHLVRNAVAHGIEPPEVRRAAGKPPIGQITCASPTKATTW